MRFGLAYHSQVAFFIHVLHSASITIRCHVVASSSCTNNFFEEIVLLGALLLYIRKEASQKIDNCSVSLSAVSIACANSRAFLKVNSVSHRRLLWIYIYIVSTTIMYKCLNYCSLGKILNKRYLPPYVPPKARQ